VQAARLLHRSSMPSWKGLRRQATPALNCLSFLGQRHLGQRHSNSPVGSNMETFSGDPLRSLPAMSPSQSLLGCFRPTSATGRPCRGPATRLLSRRTHPRSSVTDTATAARHLPSEGTRSVEEIKAGDTDVNRLSPWLALTIPLRFAPVEVIRASDGGHHIVEA